MFKNKGGGVWGLNNFLPLKRRGAYLAGGGGLIEDLWYRDIHLHETPQVAQTQKMSCMFVFLVNFSSALADKNVVEDNAQLKFARTYY